MKLDNSYYCSLLIWTKSIRLGSRDDEEKTLDICHWHIIGLNLSHTPLPVSYITTRTSVLRCRGRLKINKVTVCVCWRLFDQAGHHHSCHRRVSLTCITARRICLYQDNNQDSEGCICNFFAC